MQTRTDGKTIDISFSISGSSFPGFIGSAETGTFYGTESLKNGFTWNAGNPGTGIVPISGNNNGCSVYCHGGGTADKAPLTGGTLTVVSWAGGPSQAACGTCHGGAAFDSAASNPPLTGGHPKHAQDTNLNISCGTCHATTKDMLHIDGVVSWSLNTNNPLFGTSAVYNSLATGSTGTLAPSAGYAACNNVYCHSTVQSGADGTGAPAYAAPGWGGSGSVVCGSCHNADGSQGLVTTMDSGSHTKHLPISGAACNTCHTSSSSSTHVDGSINIVPALAYNGSAAPVPDSAPAPQPVAMPMCTEPGSCPRPPGVRRAMVARHAIR